MPRIVACPYCDARLPSPKGEDAETFLVACTQCLNAVVSPPEGDKPGKVTMTKSYRLKPGAAHMYEPGAIHAPMRDGPTRLIRIEGKDTRKLERTRIEAVS